MFFPYAALQHFVLECDNMHYGSVVWPLAEVLGGLAATSIGLLSLWMVTGRQHWFLRTVPVLAVIWLTTLIPAIDLGLVALVQCTVVVLPLGIRGIRSIQFTLASFLLFVVVFASILAFLTRVAMATWFEWPTIVWYGLGISWFGIGYALLTLLAGRIAGRQGRWGWRWLIVIAIPYVALVVERSACD